MKRAYKITFSIIKTADVWVLADSEKSAKEVVKQNPQRIEDYHYDCEVEDPECYEECSILDVSDGDPLYDENLNELTFVEYERLKIEAVKEAIKEVVEEEGGEE